MFKYYIILSLLSFSELISSQEDNSREMSADKLNEFSIEYLKNENPDSMVELCINTETLSSPEKDIYYQELENYIIAHADINNDRFELIKMSLIDILYLMKACEEYGTFFQHMEHRLGAYSIWLTYTTKTNENDLTLKMIIDNIINGISDGKDIEMAKEQYEQCIYDFARIDDQAISANIIWFYENYMK